MSVHVLYPELQSTHVLNNQSFKQSVHCLLSLLQFVQVFARLSQTPPQRGLLQLLLLSEQTVQTDVPAFQYPLHFAGVSQVA